MSLIPTQAPTEGATYAKNTVPPTILSTQVAITALLYVYGDNAPLITASYFPDFSNVVTIDFGEIYKSVLNSELPDNGDEVVLQYTYRIKFRLLLSDANSNNTEIDFWVCNALLKSATAFETWAQANFLTNQPLEKTTNYESPEWLTYLDLAEKGNRIVIGRFYPKEGGMVDCIVKDDEGAGCFSVNVNYSRLIPMVARLPHQLKGYYDIILTDGELNEICRQRYIYEERSGREKYFLFVNALGGIDTLICKGENVLAPDITHNIGRFGRQYRALDDTNDMRKWTQHIGQVPNRQRNWIYELLTAKQGAEKYDPETMKYLEIVVDSSELSMSDFGQLAGSQFSYILNETENVVADTERPDRSLHQSVADHADELYDETKRVDIAFEDDGQGGFETEELEIPATTVFVTDPRQLTTAGEAPVYYFLNGSATASGSFTPGVDDNPFLITKNASDTIRFATQNDKIGSLDINYYPVTIQSV